MKQMITILGPTASGKTPLAVAVARHIGGEIISADSRQVYRRMDIGTGKDLEDSAATTATVQCSMFNGQCSTAKVAYHLIDIVEPGTKYNLFQYQHDFAAAYEDIRNRGAWPILCGGTGLYIEAVLKGYRLSPVPQNPELRQRLAEKSLEELTSLLTELKKKTGSAMHNTTDVDTAQRAIRAIEIEAYNMNVPMEKRAMEPVKSLVVGVAVDRDVRREKITRRLQQRLDNGMVEEVRGLIAEGISPDDLIYYGLEYKYVTEYVIGRLSYDEMFSRLEIAIHQFAKRQMTWFRGMERRGIDIHWIDGRLPIEEKVEAVLKMIEMQKL